MIRILRTLPRFVDNSIILHTPRVETTTNLGKLFFNFGTAVSKESLRYKPTFLVSHIFRNPTVEVVFVVYDALSCFVFFFVPSLPCLSHGDMLEVIITIASGFISIYSHNNTEKEKTDSAGVMYYPVQESSFIMTSNRASSHCRHPFPPSLTHT